MIKHHIDSEKINIIFFWSRKDHERFCIRHCRDRNQVYFEIYISYILNMLSIHTRTHWNIFQREFAEQALGMQHLLGAHYKYGKIKPSCFSSSFSKLHLNL